MNAHAILVRPLTSTGGGTRRQSGAESGIEILRLTAALAAGNEEAFREFHAAYFDRLRRYLLVVTRGDEQAAHDALQETFIRVARHARGFDTEEKFWSWLTVLARSAAADGGRKRRSYWRLLTRYALGWLPSSCSLPEAEDAEERLYAGLFEEMKGLPDEDRALLDSKYLHGATVRELAVEMGVSERVIESRLARLRQRLRDQLLQRLKNEDAP